MPSTTLNEQASSCDSRQSSEGIISRAFRLLAQLPNSTRALPLLLLFSASLMGALFFVRLRADLNFDGEIYLSAAMKFESGMYREGLAIYPMPFHPWLISHVHHILPNWVLAGRLISFFFMTLTVVPLYLLSRDLFDRRPAFWSCLTFVLMPETLLTSNSVLRDPGFIFFFTWSIYFAQKVLQSKRLVHLIGSAASALVSTLFRIEGLIVFPLFFCLLGGLALARKKQGVGHFKLWLLWSGFVACLIAGLHIGTEWHGTMFNRYGDWLVFSDSLKDQSFLSSYHRVSNHLQQMQDTSPNSEIGQHFAETAIKFIWLIYLVGMLQMFIDVIVAVNTIPLVWSFILARYHERHVFVLIAIASLFAVSFGFFIRNDILIKRYLLMPAVLLCPWVGFGLKRIFEFVKNRSHPKLLAALVVLAVFFTPAAEFDKYFKNKDGLKSEAASWIAGQEGFNNLKIVFNDQVLKFHADMENKIRPGVITILRWDPDDKDYSQIGLFAREHKVDAVVIYSRKDRGDKIIELRGFEYLKEFSDGKKFIRIYVSVERSPMLNN
jgi:4-amino-4-deoxy-L-arabinose transferase-like glycosyltransferase